MAKVKNPLINSKQVGPLKYKRRNAKKDGFTHNVSIVRPKTNR